MKRTMGSLVLAAFLAVAPTAVKASPILDQQFAPDVPNMAVVFSELTRAQTLTVGVAGLLSRVEVLLDTAPGLAPFERSFQLIPTSAGLPVYGTQPLASFTIVLPGNSGTGTVAGFYGADLTAFGLMVDAGDVLAIVDVGAPAPDSSHWWVGRFTAPPTYLAGAHYTTFWAGQGPDTTFHSQDTSKVAYDLGFKTWVDQGAPEPEPIPEPGILILLGTGLAAIRRARRR